MITPNDTRIATFATTFFDLEVEKHEVAKQISYPHPTPPIKPRPIKALDLLSTSIFGNTTQENRQNAQNYLPEGFKDPDSQVETITLRDLYEKERSLLTQNYPGSNGYTVDELIIEIIQAICYRRPTDSDPFSCVSGPPHLDFQGLVYILQTLLEEDRFCKIFRNNFRTYSRALHAFFKEASADETDDFPDWGRVAEWAKDWYEYPMRNISEPITPVTLHYRFKDKPKGLLVDLIENYPTKAITAMHMSLATGGMINYTAGDKTTRETLAAMDAHAWFRMIKREALGILQNNKSQLMRELPDSSLFTHKETILHAD